MTTTKRIYKTPENEILIVKADTSGCNGRSYVSVTADKIEPIKRSEAVERVREWLEDGEMWKQAVELDQTTLGLDEWVDFVINTDGELSGFDNSLYDEELTIDGEVYLFDSRACGCLHDDIKEVTHDFDELIALHLKDNKKSLSKADKIILNMQKNEPDIDFEVESITREILEID